MVAGQARHRAVPNPGAMDQGPRSRLGERQAVRGAVGRGRPGYVRARRPHAAARALVIYREYYGMQPGKPNVGVKLPAEEVAREIITRETDKATGKRERINYGVADPACFAVISGPSIAETLMRHGAIFRRADNTRVPNCTATPQSRPPSLLWATVVQDTFGHDGRTIPRGALVIYREYYGMVPGKPKASSCPPRKSPARSSGARPTPRPTSASGSITAS